MSDLVKVVKEERLSIVTINHPPVNALNSQVMELLEQSFDELVADESIGAVIITGAGEKAFVAGADINEFTSLHKRSSSAAGGSLSSRK